MTNHEKLITIYDKVLHWIARCSPEDNLHLYKNELQEIEYVVQSLNRVFDKLYSSIDFKQEDVEREFKEAFNKTKQSNQSFAGFVLFTFKHDINHEIFNLHTPSLTDCLIPIEDNNYRDKYTFEDDEYTYVPNYILTYRDVNWPVFYDENSSSYYVRFIDKEGKETQFCLDWDWDCPIDEYLDLGSGEENKITL